ncbi:MAG: NFACT RNA binding domain-containing protein [Chloroflexota bacterium]|nr:NFACT RNA binding domain-containing protein [Chloroflexota bacterium]
MHVDHLTLACLRDRLDGLLGARVQRVVLPDQRSVALELYAGQRFQLLISASPQHPRMLLVPERPRRGVERASPLLLLLRKWVRGSRLTDVTQPPWERILTLHFDGEPDRCQLVAELIGRYSNVILVARDNTVLEAVKHVGPDINRYRVTLPAQPYQPPPQPPGRRAPTTVTAEEWARILSSADGDKPLHRLLTSSLFGVSPTAGREVAARVTGDPEGKAKEAPPDRIAQVLTEIFSPLDDGVWDPHVALDEEGNVIAFAPYKLHQFPHTEPAPDINDAMWRYFQQRIPADAYAVARQRVRGLIEEARSRVNQALEDVLGQAVDQEELDALREAGELLLTYQHRVERGAREVTVPGYDGEPRTIDLKPELTAVENAQSYFEHYRKRSRAAKAIPARVRTLETDLAYLEQLDTDLSLAETRPEIDAVHDALVDAGWTRKRPKQSSSGMVSRPRRFEIQGFPVFVGRNASQNEQVTFERGNADDLWLHARGLPGAHVVVKSSGRPVPNEVVERAASLAAYYSSARDSDRVEVDVTERRFVRRAPGRRAGLVTYRNERTLAVEPRTAEPSAES